MARRLPVEDPNLTYGTWAVESSIESLHDPESAWKAWLLSQTGQDWLAAHVEPAWRAYTEALWRAFMADDAWRAFVDSQRRAFVDSVGQLEITEPLWRAFLQDAMHTLLTDGTAWRALMDDDAWRALLDDSWAQFRSDYLDRQGAEWRAWRHLAATEAGWRAFGDMPNWRAFMADGWRAFIETDDAWRAFTEGPENDAWRAWRGANEWRESE